ncbi:single insulin-like growth factor-binding domain protein-2 [Trichonephila inaurata madagascariensis]|uniref:Single insulin-like growth factor-binding domain protein-2 n=1 Tax=Trichonephila inaurata madagascariensis TaxID=2747483 RepID=A0A8X6ILM3_9ARAC|nr:single insulin-like growth factor-binding domain protein-2 [Trichonephila inaurata madagascariensis]
MNANQNTQENATYEWMRVICEHMDCNATLNSVSDSCDVAVMKVMMLIFHLCGTLLIAFSLTAASDDDRDALCSEIECEDYDCMEVDECEFGEVPDVCECCYTCAKGPGESCGGMFDLAGTCAWGYTCQPHPKYPQLPGICVKY